MDRQQRVRDRILETHGSLVETVLARADAVAGDLALPADREDVVAAMDRALRDAGAFPEFVAVVRTAAAALDADLPAEPVAGPPYVVVTGRGPMVRATVDAGRIVVLFRCFEVTPDGYVRAQVDPTEALEVSIREA